MKFVKLILLASAMQWLCLSCKKSSTLSSGLASLNLINAAIADPGIAVSFIILPIPFYQSLNLIPLNSSYEFGLQAGSDPMSIISASDTTQPIFSGTLNLEAGRIYSLYLAGHAKHVDTLFMQDVIPTYGDSSAGVRFINLSAGSAPVNI